MCLLVDAPEETQVCGVEQFNDLLAALKKEQDLKYERLVKVETKLAETPEDLYNVG